MLRYYIKQMGFRAGLSFWFEFNIKANIQQFVWLNITHRPWCKEHGWYCKIKDCDALHLYSRQNILDEWDKAKKEMDKVERRPDGSCVCCGEFKATTEIVNPNNLVGYWAVCETCKKMVTQQYKLTAGYLMKNIAPSVGQKMIREAKEELDNLAEESGTEAVSIEFKYRGTKNDREPDDGDES